MLIHPNDINKLLVISGDQVTKRGKKYFEQDRVKIKEVNISKDGNFSIIVYVEGTYLYEVKILKNDEKIDYSCNCSNSNNTPCKHIIATLLDIYVNNERYETFKKVKKYDDIIKVSNILKFENEEINTKDFFKKSEDPLIKYYEKLALNSDNLNKIKLIPKIEISGFKNSDIYITLKIGTSKLYVIKDIYNFVNDLKFNRKVKYGNYFELKLDINNFENKEFVQYVFSKINEYCEFAGVFSINSKLKNKLKLMYGSIDEFFEIFKDKEIEISDYYTSVVKLVEEDPVFDLDIYIEADGLVVKSLNFEEYYIYYGKLYNYILYRGKLYRCSNEFSKNVLPLLKKYIDKNYDEIVIKKEDISSFCEYVVPNISKALNLNNISEVLKEYKPESLGTKVLLDINEKGEIVADIKFCYGSYEFNPFDKLESTDLNINRNKIEEQKIFKILFDSKFKLDRKSSKLIISYEEDIYNFIKNSINILMDRCEVLVTDKFKNKNIISNKSISLGVRVKNDLLEIELDDSEISLEELTNIIENYKLKKKFYRLKDGSFVDIENTGIETFSNILENIGVNSIKNKRFNIPKYRAMYLDKLLEQNSDINIKKESSFKELIRKVECGKEIDFKLPDNMENILRNYQKTGYNWLKTLDSLGFGGILADDMGLGKTLQVISILEKEKEESNSTSIVVCPGSLYLNWEKEINKFAKDLNVLVISGGAIYRKQLIKNIKKYDVVITSYDLLKRDFEEYKDINFRYIIADEAQYVKNSNTKNAKALKSLKGQTRFALTGTPIENSLAEIWSIFDFCMPGFLYSYSKFKDKFETSIIRDNDKVKQETLRKMVEPFILRRTKKEVLKELPDKTETKIYNIMEEKQEKIYRAYLAKAKEKLSLVMKENNFEKNKMQILALITRLRQICCHPSLFLENYDGESSKLIQCMQLIEDACNASHKILVFSQFSSMFEIIKKELDKKNIKYYELTGKTKIDERIELVDKFNKENEVKVFLISLKAGGTGLNLTSADIVIHFDPWWNLSVQNQATDRVYRIGQRKNVQVFSLITQNTIEEKVVKLQETKQNLADNIVTSSETFISKLSKDEISKLFE